MKGGGDDQMGEKKSSMCGMAGAWLTKKMARGGPTRMVRGNFLFLNGFKSAGL